MIRAVIALAIIGLLLISGCNRSQEIENNANLENEEVVVWFNVSTKQATIDSIISGGDFEIVTNYADSSYQSYTLRLPPNMTYEEASNYLESFTGTVMGVTPSCSGNDVYLWGANICVPVPDSSGNCPDGYVYAECATGSCQWCRDCIKACIPLE